MVWPRVLHMRRSRWLLVGLAATAMLIPLVWIGASTHTLTQFRIDHPGTNTAGAHGVFHFSRSVIDWELTGNIIAAGGYKNTLMFSHGDFAVASTSQGHMPVAGAIRIATGTTAGGANDESGVIRAPYAGSVIAIVLTADRQPTNGDAHASVWRRPSGQSPLNMNFRSGIVQNGTRIARNTQGRGLTPFAAGDDIGCWSFTGGTFMTNVVLRCMLVIEY